MLSSPLHQHAGTTVAKGPNPARQRLSFGFPRAYLARMLQRKLVEQLYLGDGACIAGWRDERGVFRPLEDDAGFDGPDFTLRLTHAAGGYQVFDHDIDIEVGILLGNYTLAVHGHRFGIGFLPTLDEAQLTAAARRILRDLDTAARTG
ncbi:MAG: hypothetical protein GAK35_00416 [Herbaspirillum frisingense]|uniref:Uncharacterized protein n=1 Tax=Herbaspirillum frisingense TaxID=92645 RepID=A0A7V8FZX2_9BURK|nr:MAG: hypothetical protein GAK35_00416 [Herbaspirillum frisingense]